MTDRFQLVPAAYLVLTRTGAQGTEVLLQLRQNTGYRDGHWACGAAGHVEAGETALDAAVREAREELGVQVRAQDLHFLTVMQRTHGNPERAVDERVDFFFHCATWSGEPALQEPEKSADLRWFPLGALPDPVVPHEFEILRAFASDTLEPVTFHGFPA